LSFITSWYSICTICRPLVLLAYTKNQKKIWFKWKKSDLNQKIWFFNFFKSWFFPTLHSAPNGYVTVLKFCRLPWCSASRGFVRDSWSLYNVSRKFNGNFRLSFNNITLWRSRTYIRTVFPSVTVAVLFSGKHWDGGNSTRTCDARGTARLQLVQLPTIVAANTGHPTGMLDRCRVEWQALDGPRSEHCTGLAQRTLHTSCCRLRLPLTFVNSRVLMLHLYSNHFGSFCSFAHRRYWFALHSKSVLAKGLRIGHFCLILSHLFLVMIKQCVSPVDCLTLP